jgi:hypothetical protein
MPKRPLFLTLLLIATLTLCLPKIQKTIAAEEPLQRTLSIQYQGAIRLSIIDSQNRTSGFSSANQEIQYNIPDSQIAFHANYGGISLATLIDGDYNIQIHGSYSEDYQIEINYLDSNEKVEVYRLRGFHHTDSPPANFIISLDQNNLEIPITLNHTSPLVQNVLPQPSENSGLKTKLTWEASSDLAVAHYNIYYRNAGEPFFQFLATSTDNFYITEHPWVSTEFIANTFYAVATVQADGSESFFSTIKTNDDQDFDWLTDSEEVIIGTALDNADTDNDQLMDYQEHVKYGTDPLQADTDGDTFTDYEEVQAGSNPLDAISIPDQCMPPQTGDWIITESCTFIKNLVAPANVFVQNSSVLTIDNEASLGIDFENYKLEIDSDSGVLIEPNGKLHEE